MPFFVTFKHLHLAFLTDCEVLAVPPGGSDRLHTQHGAGSHGHSGISSSSILLVKINRNNISQYLSAYCVSGVIVNALQPQEVSNIIILRFVDTDDRGSVTR